MWDSVKQSCVVVAAGLVLIPVTYWAVGSHFGADGASAVPLAFVESGLVPAIVRLAAAGVVLLAVSIAGGMLTHRYTGAFILGLGWLLMAQHAPSIDSLIRSASEHSSLGTGTYIMLAAESIVWGALSMIAVYALARFAPNRYPNEVSWSDRRSVTGAGLSLVLACAFCWVCLRTDLKGQTLYGTTAGIALAVMMTRMTWPTVSGQALFLVPVVLAILGYASSIFLVGSNALEEQLRSSLWPLLRPIPLDYAAGGMLGVSLGISLAHSFSYEDQNNLESDRRRLARDTSKRSTHSVRLIQRQA